MNMIEWKPEMVDSFWDFITERHNVYIRRFVEKLPPPWTSDPILQQYRFTNVYRELDRGTLYLIDRILPHVLSQPKWLVLFNVAAYRRFNLVETYRELGDWIEEWDEPFYLKRLQGRIARGLPVNGPAWMVNVGKSTHGPGAGLIYQCQRLTLTWQMAPQLWGQLERARSMRDAHGLLLQLPGVSDFTAYEIVIDLNYFQPHLLRFDENDWVNPGPGCVQGLDLMTRAPLRDTFLYVEAIRQLRAAQPAPLAQRNFRGEKSLSLRNIEHCLCEARKMWNAKFHGRHKRKFPGVQHSREVPLRWPV